MESLVDSVGQTEDSFDPAIQSFFTECSKKLDTHHDRYERLVKLSRDITIESKRVIFLLHRTQDDASKAKITAEADEKLKFVVNNSWKRVAKELQGQDPHHYLKAYTAGTFFLSFACNYFPTLCDCIKSLGGFLIKFQNDACFITLLVQHKSLFDNHAVILTNHNIYKFLLRIFYKINILIQLGMQEFIEALSFLQYIQSGTLITLEDVQKRLCFSDDQVPVPVYEYLLGIADLTGELMRLCINAVGRGQTELVFNTCVSLRNIHEALSSLK